MKSAHDIIQFWFQDIDKKLWFKKDSEFDESLRKNFLTLHEAAARGELFEWRKMAEGRLAEIIVLDQFSRNMFRDSAKAFASDPMSLTLAQEAVALGADQDLPPEKKAFMYLPYMHSESLVIHEQALKLFSQPGLESNLDFEKRHLEILRQFGRYPHRNKILGRESTQEEMEFLKKPGSGF